MRSSLLKTLKQLRLSGLAQSLEVRLSEAAGNRLDHAEFLELILQDEINVRSTRLIDRRVKAACFGEVKPLDEFDFAFNASIKRKQIHDLASCQFLREKADVLMLGPPGVGKTFLVRAIGHQAIKAGFLVLYRSIFDLARDFLGDEDPGRQDKILTRYLKPDLLIIDDMGMKQLPRRSGECLLEIIMRRHENRSTMMTSNRPLEDWAKLIGDAPSATAILDRFLQHATIINITGRSYRLRNGGNAEAKANRRSAVAEGRRSTGGDGSLSPPACDELSRVEDPNASVAVSSVGREIRADEPAEDDQAD
jgi:DNA replication protein DnaC